MGIMVFRFTIVLLGVLRFCIAQMTNGHTTEPWRSPCGGSSVNTIHDESSRDDDDIRFIHRRIITKIRQCMTAIHRFQETIVAERILDEAFVQELDNQNQLPGFVADASQESNLTEALFEDYLLLSRATAFVEILSLESSIWNLQTNGREVLNLMLDILCEILTVLRALSAEITAKIGRNVVPFNQRYMSTTRRLSWSYMLTRDLLRLLNNLLEKYEVRNGQGSTANFMPNLYTLPSQ